MKKMINFITDNVKFIDEISVDIYEEIDIDTLISKNPEIREKIRYEGKIKGNYVSTRKKSKNIVKNNYTEEYIADNNDFKNDTIKSRNNGIDQRYVFSKKRESIQERIYIQNLTEGHICIGYGNGEKNHGNRYIIQGFAYMKDVPAEIWDSYFFRDLFSKSKARFISEKDFVILKDAYDKKIKMLEYEKEDRKERKGLDNTIQHSEGSSHRSANELLSKSISEEIDLEKSDIGNGIGIGEILASSRSNDLMSDEEISNFMNGNF